MKLSGLKVLLLEDEPIIAIALEDILHNAGALPRTASTLEQADEAIASEQFDLAILDVNVHGTTSYDFAKELRRMAIPFIFATGYGGAAHPADFNDVPTLTKPYSAANITAALGGLPR